MDVRLNRMDWLLDDEFDPDRRGEVKHDVAPIDQLRQERLVVHRIDEVLEAGPSFQVSDVVDRPGRQVVEDEHVVTLRQHRFRKMRADEAGPSRNQRAHSYCPFVNADTAAATSSTSASSSAG